MAGFEEWLRENYGKPTYAGQANIEYEAARELYRDPWNAALRRAAEVCEKINRNSGGGFEAFADAIEREIQD